jgi:aspartyl protease family protein
MSFTKPLSLRTYITLVVLALMTAALVRANRDAVIGRSEMVPSANAAVISYPIETESSARNPGHESSRDKGDGLFYVNALVNGKPLRFLVDTGASVMVLTAADAKRVGLEIAEGHYNGNVQTVGGRTEMAWATVDHIQIGGRDVRQLRAAVVRAGLGVSLLGQNALSQFESVTIKGDRLSIR